MASGRKEANPVQLLSLVLGLAYPGAVKECNILFERVVFMLIICEHVHDDGGLNNTYSCV